MCTVKTDTFVRSSSLTTLFFFLFVCFLEHTQCGDLGWLGFSDSVSIFLVSSNVCKFSAPILYLSGQVVAWEVIFLFDYACTNTIWL